MNEIKFVVYIPKRPIKAYNYFQVPAHSTSLCAYII